MKTKTQENGAAEHNLRLAILRKQIYILCQALGESVAKIDCLNQQRRLINRTILICIAENEKCIDQIVGPIQIDQEINLCHRPIFCKSVSTHVCVCIDDVIRLSVENWRNEVLKIEFLALSTAGNFCMTEPFATFATS